MCRVYIAFIKTKRSITYVFNLALMDVMFTLNIRQGSLFILSDVISNNFCFSFYSLLFCYCYYWLSLSLSYTFLFIYFLLPLFNLWVLSSLFWVLSSFSVIIFIIYILFLLILFIIAINLLLLDYFLLSLFHLWVIFLLSLVPLLLRSIFCHRCFYCHYQLMS